MEEAPLDSPMHTLEQARHVSAMSVASGGPLPPASSLAATGRHDSAGLPDSPMAAGAAGYALPDLVRTPRPTEWCHDVGYQANMLQVRV